jgi:hypothetical protein
MTIEDMMKDRIAFLGVDLPHVLFQQPGRCFLHGNAYHRACVLFLPPVEGCLATLQDYQQLLSDSSPDLPLTTGDRTNGLVSFLVSYTFVYLGPSPSTTAH